MRTTLDLNETLLKKAKKYSKIKGKTALIHSALEALIAQAAQSHLAQMGGIQKNLKNIPRRKIK